MKTLPVEPLVSAGWVNAWAAAVAAVIAVLALLATWNIHSRAHKQADDALSQGQTQVDDARRHAEDARRQAEDIQGGTQSIAYREHVWFLARAGLRIEEIEAVLRRESLDREMPLADGNAYDGPSKANDKHPDGYRAQVGSVREILDPLGERVKDPPLPRPSAG